MEFERLRDEVFPDHDVALLHGRLKPREKEEVMAAAVHKVKGYVKKPIQMDKLMQLAKSCFQ